MPEAGSSTFGATRIPGTDVSIVYTGEPISTIGLTIFVNLPKIFEAIFGQEGEISIEKGAIEAFWNPVFEDLHAQGMPQSGDHFQQFADAQRDIQQDPVLWMMSQTMLADARAIMYPIKGLDSTDSGEVERFVYQFLDNAWGDGWTYEQMQTVWAATVASWGFQSSAFPGALQPPGLPPTVWAPQPPRYTPAVPLPPTPPFVDVPMTPTLTPEQVRYIEATGGLGRQYIELYSQPYTPSTAIQPAHSAANGYDIYYYPEGANVDTSLFHEGNIVYAGSSLFYPRALPAAFHPQVLEIPPVQQYPSAPTEPGRLNPYAPIPNVFEIPPVAPPEPDPPPPPPKPAEGCDPHCLAEISNLRQYLEGRIDQDWHYKQHTLWPAIQQVTNWTNHHAQVDIPRLDQKIDDVDRKTDFNREYSDARDNQQDARLDQHDRVLQEMPQQIYQTVLPQIGQAQQCCDRLRNQEIPRIDQQIANIFLMLTTHLTNWFMQVTNYVSQFVAGEINNFSTTFWSSVTTYVSNSFNTYNEYVTNNVKRGIHCFQYNWCGHAKQHQGMELECWFEDNTFTSRKIGIAFESWKDLHPLADAFHDLVEEQPKGPWAQAAQFMAATWDRVALEGQWPDSNGLFEALPRHGWLYKQPSTCEREIAELLFVESDILPSEKDPCRNLRLRNCE